MRINRTGITGKARGQSTYNKLNNIDLFNVLNKNVEMALSCILNKDLKKCEKTKKMYFAGPWFNEKSKMFYDAVSKIQHLCHNYSKYNVFFPRYQVNNKPSDAFIKNVSNIQDCDILVAFVDDKDVGTAWEIGMAYALGKNIVLLGLDDSTFLSHTNAMLAFTGTCTTLMEFGKLLIGKPYDIIKIEDNWEGIE